LHIYILNIFIYNKKKKFRYNNELLPSSKYYYKFKDYAPRVFRSIREICKISSEDYLVCYKLYIYLV